MVCAMNNWRLSKCVLKTLVLTTNLMILIVLEKLNLGSPSIFVKIVSPSILFIYEVARESNNTVI